MTVAIPMRTQVTVPYMLIQLTAFSIPFAIRINAITTVCCAAICLIYFIKDRKHDWGFVKTWLFVLTAAHMILLLAGLIHSANVRLGLAQVERFSFAVLFVILIYQARHTGISFTSIFVAFTAGCVTLTLYAFLYTVIIASPTDRQLILGTGHLEFTDLIGIHPTYLSLYMIFIFMSWLDHLRLNYLRLSAGRKALIVAVLVFAVVTILFVRSQLSLLIFITLLALYPVIVYRRRAILVAFFLFVAAFIVYLVDPNRVSNFFDRYGLNVSTALDNRIRLWDGAIHAIGISPWVGAGTGGEQTLLNSGYEKIGYQEGIDNSHNAHNQYLEFMIRNGFLELFLFLTFLVFCFRNAMRSLDYSALMFYMIFTLAMLAESCLNVHKGIVPFYFFSAVFLFLPITGRQHKTSL